MVNLKLTYWKNENNVLKTLNILKRNCFSYFMRKCCALSTNYSSFVSEEKFKILRLAFSKSTRWSFFFFFSDGLLSSTKHSDLPDILYQFYLRGFRAGKISCQQGSIKYFSSGRVILAAVHVSTQELFCLASQVTAQVQEDSHTGGCVTHPGLGSQRP